MPIRISEATKFQEVAQSGVDAYVQWAHNSLPYAYFGHPDSEIVAVLEQALVENGFSGWAARYRNYSYHCNDGKKEGGGFTAVVCYYGTMPCLVTLRFFLDAIEVDVWKLECDQSIRPGVRLFFLRVTGDLDVEAESFIGNVLKR